VVDHDPAHRFAPALDNDPTHHVAPAVVRDEELTARLESVVKVLVERTLILNVHNGVPAASKKGRHL